MLCKGDTLSEVIDGFTCANGTVVIGDVPYLSVNDTDVFDESMDVNNNFRVDRAIERGSIEHSSC